MAERGVTMMARAHGARVPDPFAPARSPAGARLRCACAGRSSAEDECAECAREAHEAVRRFGASPLPASPDDSSVDTALSRAGAPLDGALRSRFEQWFDFDFSRVRIHADGAGARAADALKAQAFTYGRDIVFARGEYRPHSEASQRLIAHELAHVVQQSDASEGSLTSAQPAQEERAAAQAAAAWQRSAQGPEQPHAPSVDVRRQPTPPPGGPAPTPAPAGAPPRPGTSRAQSACNPAQWNALTAAFPSAAQWLTKAEASLRQFATNPGNAGYASARDALRTHFHRTDATIALSVADALHSVWGAVQAGPGNDVRCVSAPQQPCASGADAAAQRGTRLVVFCPVYFTEGPSAQLNSLVHEYAHLNAVARHHLEDRAYGHRRQYRFLTPEEAFDNAASFSNLTEDLATGTAGSLTRQSAPQDVLAGCNRTVTDRALAIVEGWNLATFTVLSQPTTVAQAGVQNLLTTHLGNATAATVTKALRAFAMVGTALEKAMDIACERQATGSCAGSTEWFVDPPSRQHPALRWHLCPTWTSLGSHDDRAASLFRALLQHQAGLPTAEVPGHVAFARTVAPLIALAPPPAIPAPAAAPPAPATPPSAPAPAPAPPPPRGTP
jgi:hypothetical protein